MASLKHWPALLLLGTACHASAKSYDYVIVGGGTSGSALAARLSVGLPQAQILLLEAGPAAPDDVRINVPGLRGAILGTGYDWNFTTVGQRGLGGRRIEVNRGKVLGGSSAMNYLCYDRAAAAEYDAWAELGGGEAWAWEAMIRAMTRSENFTGTDRDPRGRAGPIRNIYNRVVYDVVKRWLPAARELGLPVNEDGNMYGNPIGLMFQGTNIDDRDYRRSYSANGYLPLAGPNLEVRTGARVAKVNLDGGGGGGHRGRTATGVTLDNGTIIDAAVEVILSAGSIQSPGLLELSGIGQSAVLKAAGVAPVIDLPGVGENYQDHVRVSNNYRLRDSVDSFDNLIFDPSGANATAELKKWTEGGPSLYDYTTSAYGFLDWSQVNATARDLLVSLARAEFGSSRSPVDRRKLAFLEDPSVPDVELLLDPNYVGAAGYPGSGGKYLTLISTVMHPFSRGSVHLDPANPAGAPVIDPGFLLSEHDVRAAAEGVRLARRVAETAALRDSWVAEIEPGPAVQTDDGLRKFVVDNVLSFYHPVGTCALLPRADGGVVDADLRVYGTANLRVVDASVMPIIVSGHIQTAAYGIAEVAAGKIIADAACDEDLDWT